MDSALRDAIRAEIDRRKRLAILRGQIETREYRVEHGQPISEDGLAALYDERDRLLDLAPPPPPDPEPEPGAWLVAPWDHVELRPGYCEAFVDLGAVWSGTIRCSFRAVAGGFCVRHARKRGILASLGDGNGRRWSRVDVLAAIVRWNAERGRPPTAAEWKTGGDHPGYDSVVRIFGSWANAIEAAGFARPRRGVRYGVAA